jgi:hypothetical protein
MERAPERIGVAGDWHGNTVWATRAVRKISALLPGDAPRMIVHLGDFGIWPGPGGREYLSRLDAALAAASMRWLRFQGRPVSNALRSLVSR